MSIRAIGLVLDAPIKPPTSKLAAVILADWCNDEGGSLYPSMNKIALKVGVTRSQAQRIVHGFVEQGLLSVVANAAGGKPGVTPRYQLHLDRIAALSATGSTGATGSVDATGRTDAQGSHGCTGGVAPMRQTGSTGATLTVINRQGTVTEGDAESLTRLAGSAVPNCPHLKLIALFAEKVPELPRPKAELWDGNDADAMRQRWKWVMTATREDGQRYATNELEGLDWFGRYFDRVADSDFLTGRDDAWPNCSLSWLMKRANFAKVVQGNYKNRVAA